MEAQPPKQRRRPVFLSGSSDRHLPPFRTWRCLCVNVFIFRHTCKPKKPQPPHPYRQTHTPYTPFPAAAAPAPPPAPAPPAAPAIGIVGIAMSSRVSSPAVVSVMVMVRRRAIDASGRAERSFRSPLPLLPSPPPYIYMYVHLSRIAPFSFSRSASADKSRPASRSPSCLATSCFLGGFDRDGVCVWVSRCGCKAGGLGPRGEDLPTVSFPTDHARGAVAIVSQQLKKKAKKQTHNRQHTLAQTSSFREASSPFFSRRTSASSSSSSVHFCWLFVCLGAFGGVVYGSGLY